LRSADRARAVSGFRLLLCAASERLLGVALHALFAAASDLLDWRRRRLGADLVGCYCCGAGDGPWRGAVVLAPHGKSEPRHQLKGRLSEQDSIWWREQELVASAAFDYAIAQ